MVRRLLHIWLVVSIGLIGFSSQVRVVEPLPYGPYGTVQLNGAWVPDGTPVLAFCDGVEVGSGTTQTLSGASRYSISVEGDDPETSEVDGCLSGEPVAFTVDGWPADQTGTWVEGDSEQLNLTALRPEPAITIEKATNGLDADSAPGPTIHVGETVTWTYLVTNTGNVTLTNVAVDDDVLGPISCPQTTLAPDLGMVCEATGAAEPGQYANAATVAGTYDSSIVSAADSSHYFGIAPAIKIEKSTDGEDADQGTGPLIPFGDPVTWTYGVTNTGNITLTGITVMDDIEGPVACPLDVLGPDGRMVCGATGAATAGQYINTATATGTPPVGSDVSDSDKSGYYGTVPGITLATMTNGVHADAQPGPFILVGDPVTWTYVISNSGNISLSGLSLVDSRIGDVTSDCPSTDLDAGEAVTCTATGTAATGQYTNQATVEAVPPVGNRVTASDSGYYFGSDPSIAIEKATLGIDADEPSGPVLLEGETVTWTYAISNTGNVTLTAVTVEDDQLGVIGCPVEALAPGARQTCEAVGAAVPGQYRNLGTATGSPPGALESVSARDPSHYFAYTPYPSVKLEKRVNGVLAPESPGLYVSAGEAIIWTYTLLNTGNTQLQTLSVRDDQGTLDDPSDDREICTVDTLDVQTTTVCTSTGVAAVGAYVNVAQVIGTAVSDDVVSATSVSHYYGAVPSLAFEKATNGQDADTGIGPLIPVGDTVTWTYGVTNTGNITLTNVSVTDDQNITVVCPSTIIAAQGAMTCAASGMATPGPYRNVGRVSATPWVGQILTATDPSHYYGAAPSIEVEKATNGADGDVEPGIFVSVGQDITWTYQVMNTGNVDLHDVSVVDSELGPIDCPQTTLAVGEGMTCEVKGIATSGQYGNVATVTGTSPLGTPVSANDASHYFGAEPSLTFVKLTAGKNADEPAGPWLWAGYPVTWTYLLTNTGNVTVTQIAVVDDREGTVVCPDAILAPDERMTCSEYGTVKEGGYANVGTASALAADGTVITTSDRSHYLGVVLDFSVRLLLSLDEGLTWIDTQEMSPPRLLSGTDPRVHLVITNTGSITATDIGWASDALDLSMCGVPDTLAPDGIWTCTISSPWDANLRALDVEISAAAVDDAGTRRMLTKRDRSYYYGAVPELAVNKFVSGDDGDHWYDADTPPGPSFPLDAPLQYRLVVTNTGNVPLRDLMLEDDALDLDACTWGDPFAVDEVFTCDISGTWKAGEHMNTVTATGHFTDDVGAVADPGDSDRAYYFGTALGLSVEKRVAFDASRWYDADLETDALTITVDTPIYWRVIISNTGTVPLALSILDERDGLPVALGTLCNEPPPDGLSPGAGYQCTFEDAVTSKSPGLHVNRLSVEGTYEDSQVRIIDEAYVTVLQYRVYLPVLFR